MAERRGGQLGRTGTSGPCGTARSYLGEGITKSDEALEAAGLRK